MEQFKQSIIPDEIVRQQMPPQPSSPRLRNNEITIEDFMLLATRIMTHSAETEQFKHASSLQQG